MKMEKPYILWLVLMLVVAVSGEEDDDDGVHEVVVGGGVVRGTTRHSAHGNTYHAFQAIPYALPPIGDLRFKPPKGGVNWSGVYDGTQAGEPCAQAALGVVAGMEDCLHLYVYTPKLPEPSVNASLPVIVWLHGGAFVIGGAADLDERFIMDRDVVLVIPQYRLGILGYFHTPSGSNPGNLGALDQVLALNWVKDNIGVFGGNANMVTLAGDCAGGASAIYHLMSPLSQGLFHGVWSLSGSPLNPWAFYFNNHRFLLLLARYLRCPAHDQSVLIKCLQDLPQEELLEAVQLVIEARDLLVGNHRLAPTRQVPSNSHVTTLFLDRHPLEALTLGDVAGVPVVMGVTRDVGSYLVDMMLYDFILFKLEDNENFLSELLPMLLKECFIPDPNEHVEEFADFYFPGNKFDNLDDMLPGLVQILGDLQYKAGIMNAANLLSNHVPTRVFRFEFEGGPNLFDIRHPNKSAAPPLPFAVGHGDEMTLILPDQRLAEFTIEQQKVSNTLIEMLVNFAHGRAPRQDWPLYTTNHQEALVVSSDGSLRREVFDSPKNIAMLNKIHGYHHIKIIKEMKEDTQEHDEL